MDAEGILIRSTLIPGLFHNQSGRSAHTNEYEGIRLIQHSSGDFLAAAFADRASLPVCWHAWIAYTGLWDLVLRRNDEGKNSGNLSHQTSYLFSNL